MAVVDDWFKDNPVFQLDCPVIYVHAGEEAKTLATVEKIVRDLMSLESDRDTFLLGIGGGIITDLTGFVASIYKRGLHYGLIPTTLLAQVDAALGGKSGVNFDHFKNVLGSFSEADFVCIDPQLTATLPRREMLCGAAEMLKTFLIADGKAFEEAVRFFAGDRNDSEELLALVRRAVEIKADIVSRDPYDRGERMKLNLGHTFAHAIEKCSGKYLHGEAVAIGIVMAAELSVEKGFLRKEDAETIRKAFESVGLPVVCELPQVDILKAIRQDKKRSGETQKFILPTSIGSVMIWETSVTA